MRMVLTNITPVHLCWGHLRNGHAWLKHSVKMEVEAMVVISFLGVIEMRQFSSLDFRVYYLTP